MTESTPVYVDSKQCAECDNVKPLNMFSRRGRGHAAICDQCAGLVTPPPGYKTCRGECGEAKPLSEFYSKGRGRGPQSKCKVCISGIRKDDYQRDTERHRARRREYYWNNREASLAASAEWKRENPLDPEVERHKRRARYEANPEKYYAWAARWRAANPERHRENSRKWAARYRETNLEHVQEAGRRAASIRRARLRNLPCEPYTTAELLERDGTNCVLCDEPLDLNVSYPDPLAPTREHLECLSWPEATAGDVPSNVAVSHWKCNNERKDRPHPAAARKRAELLAAEQEATA